MDFHEAFKRCLDEKAVLASIHDKNEQAYINSMVSSLLFGLFGS